jgi:DNA polymerase-4
MSLDEAYLDVTDVPLPKGSATLLAQEIRQKIFNTTGLTASAGIAPNKLVAKLASEVNKPNGQFTVAPEQVEQFMVDLPLGKIHGVGKVTSDFLASQGFKSCRDILPLSRLELALRFGKLGELLFYAARGISFSPVCSDGPRKSLSTEETFSQDLSDLSEMRLRVHELVEDLKRQLEKHTERKISGLVVKIKYFDFKLTTIERSGFKVEEDHFWQLFLERWSEQPRPIRLIGVGVKFQDIQSITQLSFDALEIPG